MTGTGKCDWLRFGLFPANYFVSHVGSQITWYRYAYVKRADMRGANVKRKGALASVRLSNLSDIRSRYNPQTSRNQEMHRDASMIFGITQTEQ